VLSILEGHARDVTGCAVTPDGRRAVSASGDRTFKVWDLGTGQCLATVHGTGGFSGVAAVGELLCATDAACNLWILEPLATAEVHPAR
jgi:WD40 repeat protein